MINIPTITLNDKNQMPLLGLDLELIAKPQMRQAVKMAVKNGYRLFDAGENDDTQIALGEALKETDVDRKDVFVITKISVSNMNFSRTNQEIDHMLKKLDMNYIDLVLLHQPYGDTFGAWDALSAAKREGKIHSIGLANFYPDQYVNLELAHEDKPAFNQIEVSPMFQQTNDIAFFKGRDVGVGAEYPFAKDNNKLLENKLLKKIAESHHKTVKQVILRWLVQRNIVVTPASDHEKDQKEFTDIFDFDLSQDEMIEIKSLDEAQSQYFDRRDPAVIDDIYGESLKQLIKSE